MAKDAVQCRQHSIEQHALVYTASAYVGRAFRNFATRLVRHYDQYFHNMNHWFYAKQVTVNMVK